MKWIPELNQYLATFPNQETLKIQNLKETKNIILKGVFLINSKDNNVTFRNSLLQNHVSQLRGHPKFLEVLNLDFGKIQKHDFTVQLKNLNLKNISMNNVKPVFESDHLTASLWTSLYTALLVAVINVIYQKFFKRVSPVPDAQPPPEVLFWDGRVM
ncbi:hypothetical protein LSTR_LSTR009782 [Laodelphax striatellus]|uniref:Uncharacterized protein n=1 Tax=Laodelphax striatellus TaxID=195883 RepID=A0A482XQ39_LAOST|nr:hypothetical protein LSTR_LSTR009782 [Laodelphax striatellus]